MRKNNSERSEQASQTIFVTQKKKIVANNSMHKIVYLKVEIQRSSL